MKMNKLDMVIDILSDMDSDNINAIGDTEESAQVARILKSVYYDIISRKDWLHLRQALVMENSGDAAIPNRLRLPQSVSKLDFFSYSSQTEPSDELKFKELIYLYPDDFLIKTNARNGSDDRVDVVYINGITTFIANDKAPTYYTSFDDEWLITDSYSSEMSDTLLGTKAQCVAYVTPVWGETDTFIPDLPTEAFPLFLAEARSTCFYRMKQTQDPKSDKQVVDGNRAMAQRGWKIKGGVRYDNYGRQSKKGRQGSHFNRS